MPRYLCVLFESKVNENSAARGVIQPDDCIHIYLYVYIFIYRYVPPSCFTKETFSTSRNHTGGRTARAVESNYSYGNGGRNARKEQCAPRDCNTAAPSPPRSASPHYRKLTFPSLPSPPLPPGNKCQLYTFIRVYGVQQYVRTQNTTVCRPAGLSIHRRELHVCHVTPKKLLGVQSYTPAVLLTFPTPIYRVLRWPRWPCSIPGVGNLFVGTSHNFYKVTKVTEFNEPHCRNNLFFFSFASSSPFFSLVVVVNSIWNWQVGLTVSLQ